jgi:hypothetical protein
MADTLLKDVSTLLEQRREAGRQARASLRLEGLVSDEKAQAIFTKWEAGELSDEEMLAQIKSSTQSLTR